jgi:transposase
MRIFGGFAAFHRYVRPRDCSREDLPAIIEILTAPDDIHEHVLECCPDCGRQLSDGWLHASRQVIEITRPQVRVVEHRFLRRRCGVCGKNWLPKASELQLGTVGRRRFGVSIQSLVSLLQMAYRLPIEMMRRLLAEFWGLQISAGEIVALTAGVAKAGAKEVAQIQQQVRGSPVVCCDETGWREDGLNGYLWTFATPMLRYFHCQRSRALEVAEKVLGKDFTCT